MEAIDRVRTRSYSSRAPERHSVCRDPGRHRLRDRRPVRPGLGRRRRLLAPRQRRATLEPPARVRRATANLTSDRRTPSGQLLTNPVQGRGEEHDRDSTLCCAERKPPGPRGVATARRETMDRLMLVRADAPREGICMSTRRDPSGGAPGFIPPTQRPGTANGVGRPLPLLIAGTFSMEILDGTVIAPAARISPSTSGFRLSTSTWRSPPTCSPWPY